MIDHYQTISSPSVGTYKEKGSKFIAHAFPITNENDFKAHLDNLKKKYHDAGHHCYAFRLGPEADFFRYSDDGEPKNSAGSPIYGQLKSFNLTHVAVVVMRYFGGTKLGVGGLISAYKEATREALLESTIITQTVNDHYALTFHYEIMSQVMNTIKQNQIEIASQRLEEEGNLVVQIRHRDSATIVTQLEKIEGLKIRFLKTT